MISVKKLLALGCVALGLLAHLPAQAEPLKPVCVVPAKPGGGFDLACRIAALICGGASVRPPTNNLPPSAAAKAMRWWRIHRVRY